ncbi:MAG: PLP-dependent transferase [Ferruginibacter sp.]
MITGNDTENNEPVFSDMGSVAIHAGGKLNAEHAHLTPIYATSTFLFDSAEQGMDRFSRKEKGFIYSRFGNPTTAMAAEIIASLEAFGLTGEDGKELRLEALLHASGQAAMATMLLSNLAAGDSILSHYSLYGGTHQFIYDLLPKYGIRSLVADFSDIVQLEKSITENPSLKLIHIETPANPTMACVDLELVIRLARQYGLLVTVDNTFATPYLQQPFKWS